MLQTLAEHGGLEHAGPIGRVGQHLIWFENFMKTGINLLQQTEVDMNTDLKIRWRNHLGKWYELFNENKELVGT
jgi:hypothetical protein